MPLGDGVGQVLAPLVVGGLLWGPPGAAVAVAAAALAGTLAFLVSRWVGV